MSQPVAQSPLTYLKQQLNFAVKEWQELTEHDKADLKAYAQIEMDIARGAYNAEA